MVKKKLVEKKMVETKIGRGKKVDRKFSRSIFFSINIFFQPSFFFPDKLFLDQIFSEEQKYPITSVTSLNLSV